MVFGSLFSGIGGFDIGLIDSGMECAFQVEKDNRCQSVLTKHFPGIPLFDDVGDFNATNISVRPDLIRVRSGG